MTANPLTNLPDPSTPGTNGRQPDPASPSPSPPPESVAESNAHADPQPQVVASQHQVGVRYVRRIVPDVVETAADDTVEMSATDLAPAHMPALRRLRAALIGTPIPTEQAMHERIGRFKALAILSSDALSSVAYGTEASLAVLVAAGAASLGYNLALGAVVVVLLAIVASSYRQTIFHYPNGGGSYVVAKENLNVHFGLVAAAALLIDYVLTVSVSVSAGVDALTSAFPGLAPSAVALGVTLIILMVLVNLRGVRESGAIFAAPTYLFVASFLVMLGLGLAHALTHGGLLQAVPAAPSNIPLTAHLSVFLLLTAFASGCSAMTGTEAISNSVPIFQAPQSRNAARTLTTMAALLGVMYGGTTFLAWRFGITPQMNSTPTLISQMASLFFTGWLGWFYYVFQFATMLILVLAANTSFAGFPRLSSILARDDYLPHLFTSQGDRLAFSAGIMVLGVLAAVLLVVFNGNTDALINLYSLGVFTAFTLSQSGMVRRWRRTREPGWQRGLAINALGAVATGIVTVVIAVSKFDRGAWVVVVLVPLIYLLFWAIQRHYARVRLEVSRVPVRRPETAARHLVVVPIAGINNLAKRGLAYARSLSPYVLAVYVSTTPEEAAQVRTDWEHLVHDEGFLVTGPPAEPVDEEDAAEGGIKTCVGPISGPELVLIDSPYRELTTPVIHFIDKLQRSAPDDLITVVLPEFVISNLWEAILHNQTALRLKLALWRRSQIVTANVPYTPRRAARSVAS